MTTTATAATTNSTANTANAANSGVGQQTGTESSLSNWAGPYVTDMLAKGQALAGSDYQAYTGPLTAGASPVQQTAFQGIAGLTIPTEQMKAFTPQQFTAEDASRLMNPYLEAALNPQIAEARRQSQIQNLQNRTALTKAGAFGGGRGALMESEAQRNLQTNLANITGRGYQTAYDQAMAQFNREQDLGLSATKAAQDYGLAALQKQADLGAQQRAIESEGIAADIAQFKEERDFPYKQVQYQQSLLQGLPLAAQTYSYSQPSTLSNILNQSGGLMDLYDRIFGGSGGSGGAEGGPTLIANPATEGQPGYGWRYYTDGTAIAPTGEYYYKGEKVWTPPAATTSGTATSGTAASGTATSGTGSTTTIPG